MSECEIDREKLLAISSIKTLKTLGVSRNEIEATWIRPLCSMPLLSTLYILGNGIGDRGVRILAYIPSLKLLGVGGCDLSAVGARYISRHAGIEELHIFENAIGNEGSAGNRAHAVAQEARGIRLWNRCRRA